MSDDWDFSRAQEEHVELCLVMRIPSVAALGLRWLLLVGLAGSLMEMLDFQRPKTASREPGSFCIYTGQPVPPEMVMGTGFQCCLP